MFFSTTNKPSLRVLMYHKIIANGSTDFLSVTIDQLKEQLQYLKNEGYHFFSFSELLHFHQQQQPLPPKSILLSFDDGYQDNLTNLYPILQSFGIKANIFLVCQFAEKEFLNDQHYMNVDTLKQLDQSLIEFGLHSYKHDSYKKLSMEAIKKDIADCNNFWQQHNIVVHHCLAYPYGSFERNYFKQKKFFTTLQNAGVQLAFRIGNRINFWPLKNSMLVQRIDVRGDESFDTFCRKVYKGKKRF